MEVHFDLHHVLMSITLTQKICLHYFHSSEDTLLETSLIDSHPTNHMKQIKMDFHCLDFSTVIFIITQVCYFAGFGVFVSGCCRPKYRPSDLPQTRQDTADKYRWIMAQDFCMILLSFRDLYLSCCARLFGEPFPILSINVEAPGYPCIASSGYHGNVSHFVQLTV